MNEINICFICDEKYAVQTAVAIYSIKKVKDLSTVYNIYILGDKLTNNSITLLKKNTDKNFFVNILAINHNEFDDLQIQDIHVSKAALCKFYIARIFSKLDKILYLDSDIIVKKDLKSLFNNDISNFYAAVVKDYKAMNYNPPQTVKLKINHKAYFNSGVMLLNLEKIRNDKLEEKLINYRFTGINYFMDQDAFNVVFGENVKYISFLNNVILSVVGYFSDMQLINYYQLQEVCYSKRDIYDNATIIHLATPYKPWIYKNVLFSREWNDLYAEIVDKPLNLKILDEKMLKLAFPAINIRKKPIFWNIDLPVIVSLTTTPKRIKKVLKVIESINNQTVIVDKIVLALGEDLFQKENNEIPIELLFADINKLEIIWDEDIGPHTKYFYTMKKYENSIVITVDDDIYYPETFIEELLNSYIKFPYAISARRAHLIKFDKAGNLLPYNDWKFSCTDIKVPSLLLMATGVGGVLYPPKCMNDELFNKEAIKRLCLKADDLWLKFMQLINDTPVVIASEKCKLNFIEDTQQFGLCNDNVNNGMNDKQLMSILKEYNEYLSKEYNLIDKLLFCYKNKEALISFSENTDTFYIKSKNELNSIKASKAYKIGKIIVWLPKKIKGGIHCYKEHGLKYTLWRIKQKTVNLFK